MKRLLAEPLLHFLLIGALLFALFAYVGTEEGARDDRIVVSAGMVEHLSALFERTWNRPPTRQELEGLIDDHVREEAAYREGMGLGLDLDDAIIRRRIRQKMDFIAEDLATRVEPGDEELRSFLTEHADDFRIEGRFSFRHVFLNPETRGERLEEEARQLLGTLNAEPRADASERGDRILLDHAYPAASRDEVGSLFGAPFADAVASLEAGSWQGPIRSGYGMHLVIVDERQAGRVPELDEVRGAVEVEWDNARQIEVVEAFYRELLGKFDVVIEWPEEAEAKEPAR